MMTLINSLELKNFKSYKSQKLAFSTLTIFCGANSVGKSTAIQSIGMFLQSDFSRTASIKINGELVHIGNLDDIHSHHGRDEDELIIKIDGDNFSGCWGYNSAEQRISLADKNELLFIGQDDDYADLLDFFQTRGSFEYQYLEAERFGPRDNLPLAQHNHHENWLGTKGEFVIEVLESLVLKRRIELSLKSREEGDPRRHSKVANDYVFQNVEAWMAEISPGHRINPQKEARANAAFNSILPMHGEETKPVNIGFGYSYSLGIVTALMLASPGDVIVIENPEAHLHPRGQSYLGRLIALTAQAGIQVIIETHSDHIINGVRIMPRLGRVDPSIIKIFQVQSSDTGASIEEITVNEFGQFSTWPENFFDQQVIDMDILLSGQES